MLSPGDSSNFKTLNMEYHQKSNNHQTAIIALVLEKDMKNAKRNAHSGLKKGILVALETAYFLSSEGIA